MLGALYHVLFQRIVRRRVPLSISALALATIASVFAASLPIDMSFRPLFSNDPEALAATDAFEAEFGQESGSHIGVILEPDNVFTDAFVRSLHELSDAASELDHVTNVVSLTHLNVPEWTGRELIARRWPRDGLDYAHAASSLRIFAQAQPLAINSLLSDDFSTTVLWIRLDIPMADLAARRDVLARFEALVEKRLPMTMARFVGVSVVEAAYADIVLSSLVNSVGLTVVIVVLMLFLVFGDVRAVIVAIAGVSLAVPITLGIMQLRGQALTIMNSMVPTLVLVVGVADAVHMLLSYGEQRALGHSRPDANRRMFNEMATPCLMTTVTTVAGFLSLQFADMAAIRNLGVNVAIGVTCVYFLNLILIPVLLQWLDPRVRAGRTLFDRALARPLNSLTEIVVRRPAFVSAAVGLIFLVTAATIPGLVVQQRFNEELDPEHSVRVAQALQEEHFGGILGPEISVARADGAPLLGVEDEERIQRFTDALVSETNVLSVRSYLDFLPADTPREHVADALAALRRGPLGVSLRGVLNENATRAGVIVRTLDMGSQEATHFVRDVEALAEEILGSRFQIRVVGQWWLAQIGMSHLLRDMLMSFGMACIIVIPILAFTVRRWTLFLVSVVGNMLPMLFALGLMSTLGISLRIGTSVILAIALGIAIDDTIHFVVRLRRECVHNTDPRASVRHALHSSGRAILYTSVILIVGFGSMSTSSLLAIRDMGIVGSCTFAAALIADLVLVPALFLILAKHEK